MKFKILCKVGLHRWDGPGDFTIFCAGARRQCKSCGKVIDERCSLCKSGGDCLEEQLKRWSHERESKEKKEIQKMKIAFKQAIQEFQEEKSKTK